MLHCLKIQQLQILVLLLLLVLQLVLLHHLLNHQHMIRNYLLYHHKDLSMILSNNGLLPCIKISCFIKYTIFNPIINSNFICFTNLLECILIFCNNLCNYIFLFIEIRLSSFIMNNSFISLFFKLFSFFHFCMYSTFTRI